MAELAIVGLVSNIISFIDFGANVLSTVHEVRGSQHGTTAEIDELMHLMENVEISNKKVSAMRSSARTLSKEELNLLDLVKDCELLADEMKKIFKKLKRLKTSWKTVEEWRIALRFMYKRKDLESLRRRFEIIDNRIRSNFTSILQAGRHSATMAELDKVTQQQASLGIKHSTKLTELKNELIAVTKQRSQDTEQRADNRVAQLAKIQLLLEDYAHSIRQNRLIESLYVPILNKRWRDIKSADKMSNRWLFDHDLRFTTWLQSGNGVYLVSGKAGSGKSTLMKYAAEHPDTLDYLRQWATPLRLCTASFYFWNLGFELQKSQRGLLQSLLYQILRATPELEKTLKNNRVEHEEWDLDQLALAFQQVSHADMNTKYCFFIDGLDEYDGQESEVVEILSFLTKSENFKICASSRYRFIFENDIKNLWHKVDIAVHTKADMANHVRDNLLEEPNFKELHANDQIGCSQIVTDITEYAKGVWLWVALVTKDLVQAAKTGEQVKKLQEITKNFPRGLSDYFKAMMDKIDSIYHSDMAKILLLAINARNPLPLFAFSLLELEEAEPGYAINARCRPIDRFNYAQMKSRLHNRCGDLMVVEAKEHTTSTINSNGFPGETTPKFLRYPVDFAHRTVAEFVRENYVKEIRMRVEVSFNPMLSLCRMQLFFLKSLKIHRIKVPEMAMVSQLLRISGDVLHYAREVEYRLQLPAQSPPTSILDELDRVNSDYAQYIDFSCHWTGFAEYVEAEREGRRTTLEHEHIQDIELMMKEHRNFLALAVHVELTNYVRTKLEENSTQLEKIGPPLLRYVLSPKSCAFTHSLGISSAVQMSKKVEMVRLLLQHDISAQENINRILPYDTQRSYEIEPTVWREYIIWLSDYYGEGVPREGGESSKRDAEYEICRLLIQAGADPSDRLMESRKGHVGHVSSIMKRVFDVEQAATLLQMMTERQEKKWLFQGSLLIPPFNEESHTEEREARKSSRCTIM